MDLDRAIHTLQARHSKIMSMPAPPANAIAVLERDYNRLLNLHPEHPGLLFFIGSLMSQTDRGGIGIALLREAINRGADGPQPWLNMGAAYKTEHKDASAAECYKKALDICAQQDWTNATDTRNGLPAPHDTEALCYYKSSALHGMASLYVNAGQPEKIIEWADKALEIDPRDRFALWNKGLGLLESGRFREGFALYDRAGFMEGGGKACERKVKTYGGLPKWSGPADWQNRHGGLRGAEVEKPTVICYGEQGIGDELMLASMLPDLMRDCRVIIDCDKRLEAMFRRSFPEAEAIYPTSGHDEPFPWIADHQVDAWVPMGSLGMYYRPDFASFPRTPFLKADPTKVEKWARILGPQTCPRIGISWAGGLKKTRFDQRSLALETWAPFLKLPGVEWHSLQYHPQAADETANVGRAIGVPIHHWHDVATDYEELSGFLQHLDLVITVNTSLLHLCGGLGVPTWCLTPRMVAWRYGCSGANPWYGSVETFRQEKAGDWAAVLSEVGSRLTAMQSIMMKEAA